MELRSGALLASGTGFTSAEQARAACLGQARVQLPPAGRPAFEAAVRGVLRRWTALRLAVENGWAGDDSDARAAELEESILGWFYAKGARAAARLPLLLRCSCGALPAAAVARRRGDTRALTRGARGAGAARRVRGSRAAARRLPMT